MFRANGLISPAAFLVVVLALLLFQLTATAAAAAAAAATSHTALACDSRSDAVDVGVSIGSAPPPLNYFAEDAYERSDTEELPTIVVERRSLKAIELLATSSIGLTLGTVAHLLKQHHERENNSNKGNEKDEERLGNGDFVRE